MQKNLTLTVEADVLKAARRIALDRDTSVNQLVRDYLTELVNQSDRQKAALRDIEQMFRTSRYEIGPITWTRDDLHER